LNTYQDSEAIRKNLPNLITQLNVKMWGREYRDEQDHRLGGSVLHQKKLVHVADIIVKGSEGGDSFFYRFNHSFRTAKVYFSILIGVLQV
jgi:hypothetical protein